MLLEFLPLIGIYQIIDIYLQREWWKSKLLVFNSHILPIKFQTLDDGFMDFVVLLL